MLLDVYIGLQGGTMNREWHKDHKMPASATPRERVEWHLEHTRHCACRPFPKGLLGKMSEEEKQRVGVSSVNER
jgi:hypothetical protein